MFDEYGPYLTTQECCEAIMVGKNTIYTLIKEGKLSGARIGNRLWRIPKISLINYIQKESGIRLGNEVNKL